MKLSYKILKMPTCFVKGCKTNDRTVKGSDVSFHSFPKGQHKTWLSLAGKDVDTLIIQQRICSVHFQEDDFERIGLYKKLKKNVNPSVNLPNTDSSCPVDAIPNSQSETGVDVDKCHFTSESDMSTGSSNSQESELPTSQTLETEAIIFKREKDSSSENEEPCDFLNTKKKFIRKMHSYSVSGRKVSFMERKICALQQKYEYFQKQEKLLTSKVRLLMDILENLKKDAHD